MRSNQRTAMRNPVAAVTTGTSAASLGRWHGPGHRVFLGDADQGGACSPPKGAPERPKHSKSEERHAPSVRNPETPDDARTVLAERLEFHGLRGGLRPEESARDRRGCVRGQVFERSPVDRLAETPDGPGPMPAVRLRAGPAPALRIGGHLVRVLAELP